MLLTRFKDFVWLLIGGVGLIVIVYFGAKILGAKQYEPDNSKYIFETSIKFVDKPIYITKIKARIDTLYEPKFINGDTVYVAYQTAVADTILKSDSSKIGITYYFPPKNYFNIDAHIKEKIITHEITKELPYDPSFWDRFNVVIYGGIGYDFIERRPSISIGVGFGIDIKKIF